MLVERKSPKRSTYPNDFYVDSEARKISRDNDVPKQGSLVLHLSLPHINWFALQLSDEKRKTNVGFWGFSAGLDYFHPKNQFLSLTGGSVTDFFAPVPAAVSFSGEYERMYSTFVAASNNHIINKFSLGYGLSFNCNTWERHYNPIDENASATEVDRKVKNALGLMASAYWRVGRHFNLGITYRPSLISLDDTDSKYEHVVSLDLAWKIRL